MLAKDIIRIILYGVGLSSLGCVIYFAGPFIAFGDWHRARRTTSHPPDRNSAPLATAAAGIGGFSYFRQRKNAEKIA